jgi:hypothetical protein
LRSADGEPAGAVTSRVMVTVRAAGSAATHGAGSTVDARCAGSGEAAASSARNVGSGEWGDSLMRALASFAGDR